MKKILVVDDEKEICSLVENVLSGEGYQVFKANKCDEVLSRLDEISPDLILIDVIMPEMSGIELCEKIKENPLFENVPVLMMTGYDNEERKADSYASGANNFIAKPFNIKELVSIIKNEFAEVQHS